MADRRRPFRCRLLTLGQAFFDGQAVGATFTATDGLMGVLAMRGPLVAALGVGPVSMTEPAGGLRQYVVVGGFAHVRHNELTILADQCLDVESLSPQEAAERIDLARRQPADTPSAAEARRLAVRAARIAFDLVQKRRERQRLAAAGRVGPQHAPDTDWS